MSDVLSQLKDLKSNPKAGWISESAKEHSRQVLLQAIGHEEASVQLLSTSSNGGTTFMRWAFFDLISKPLATGAFIFVFALSGWITTVNAASNSLPGDTLYSLKRVTERAQLKLSSLEDRAVLHTEFANRRLEEAAAMTQSGDPQKKDLVEGAYADAKQEIDLAQGDLRELSKSGSADTAKVAGVIDQKIEQLSSVIGQTEPTDVEVVTAAVTGVADAAQAASDAVIEVLVDTHEAAPETSHVDLAQLFREQVDDLEDRQTFDLGRVAMIRKVLAAHPELASTSGLPVASDLSRLEYSITSATAGLPDAMDRLVAGGSRDAFDSLSSIGASLRSIEAEIANIEVAITTAISSLGSNKNDSSGSGSSSGVGETL